MRPALLLVSLSFATACSDNGEPVLMSGDDGASTGVASDSSSSGGLPPASGDGTSTGNVDGESDDGESDEGDDMPIGDSSGDSGTGTSTDGGSDGPCIPTTCEELGYDCGTIFDGCGGTEACGTCEEPSTCGTFEDNVCGCEETEWVIEHVDFMNDIGSYNALAVDSTGTPHIAYFDATNAELRYATRAADGTWMTEVLDPAWQVGRHAAMTVDANDGLHVTYHDATAQALRYAYKPEGGTWSSEVASENDDGFGSDVVVDSDGVVHISHLRGGQVPYYTYGNAGAFATEQAGVGAVGAHSPTQETGIGIDAMGRIHMCIGGETHNATSAQLTARTLHYAYRSPIGAWSREMIEGGGGDFVGYDCDLEVDATGAVHILHYATHDGDLRYATNPTPPLGDWTFEVADSVGDVGAQPSLSVDEFGTVHASYYDATNAVLRRGQRPVDSPWESQLLTDGTGLPSEGEIGRYSDLIAQDANALHVSYYEGLSDDLYYAYLATCPQ